MTGINTVIGNNCTIGTAAEVATFLNGKTGKYIAFAWDDMKETGDADPDSFEDVLSRVNYKAAKYCLNNRKILGDGRQFDIQIGSQGISTNWESGTSKTSYQLSTTFYASNSNPPIPSVGDF